MNNQLFHNPNSLVPPDESVPVAPLRPDGEMGGTDHGVALSLQDYK